MSLAAAPRMASAYAKAEQMHNDNASGAQSLLHLAAPPPNYPARISAIAAYFALLAAFVTVGFKAPESPVDEQQVVELAPIPAEEEPPPEDAPPLPETMEIPEAPPPALDPIAPVEEVKPVEKPKPLPKPTPKIERTVEKSRPHAEPRPAQTSTRREAKPAKPTPRAAAAPAVRAPAAPPGATLSASANAYHGCLQRAAGNMDAPVRGRVTYHATVSATGAVTSFSIISSSNPSLASLAQRIGSRCGSVPAPGRPGSLSGGISFSGP